jgi:hypothetical protein
VGLGALVGLVLAAGFPAGVAAAPTGGGNAFNELAGGGQPETATTPTTKAPTKSTASTETTSGSSTKTVLILGFVAAGVVLVGIAFVIMRDARKVAPVGDGPVGGGSARDPAARLRKRRAQAKAARQQRKRNR